MKLVALLQVGWLLMAQNVEPCPKGLDATAGRDYLRAEPLLRQCTQTAGAPLEAFLALAGVYQALEKPDELHRLSLQAIQRFPSEKRFYLTAGTYAGRQKQFDTAVEVLSAGLKRWPEDMKVRALLANAYYGRGTFSLDSGKNQEATVDLKKSVELAPDDVEAWMNLGRAQHNSLRYSDALQSFETVAKLRPAFPLVRFHCALSRHSLGDFEGAIRDSNAQIESERAYAPAYLVRGLSYLARGEAEMAAADLKVASERMPDAPSAQYGYARALMRLDQFDEAEQRLRAAIKLDPSDPAPVQTLAGLLGRLDRGEEARTLAKQAAVLAKERRSVAAGEIKFYRPLP